MPKFVANLTMLYNELDFLDRFAAAVADGFTGVEFLFPYAYPKEALAERLQGPGLAQALHNLPAGDWAGVGCEYKPKAKTADGLAWFDRYRGNRGHAA